MRKISSSFWSGNFRPVLCAESAVTLNCCELRLEQTATKHIRYASLLIRSTGEIDPQQNRVNFSAILTMN